MTAAEKYAAAEVAELDAALEQGRYDTLSSDRDCYARLSAGAALAWNFGRAREWAELYDAADSRVRELLARREADVIARQGVA